MKQEQDGGEGSTNYQAAGDINQYGLTVDQLAELKQHLDANVIGEVELAVNRQIESIKNDFVKFTGEANAQAMAIAQHLLTSFIEQLAARAPQNIDAMKTPAMQQAILSACTSAAVADDEDLTQTLVDILIDKGGTEPRSFKSVVLSEALEVARKLTPDQIALLTALVMLTRTLSHHLNSVDLVISELDQRCRPLYGKLPTSTSALQYAAYTGVGSEAIVAGKIAQAIVQTYDGVLTRGFTVSQLPEGMASAVNALPFVDPRLSASDDDEDPRLRVPVASSQSLDRYRSGGELNEPYLAHCDALKELITSNHLPAEQFTQLVESEAPDLAEFFRSIDELDAAGFRLTSVGVAIGQANWRRLAPDQAPNVDIYLT